MHDSDVDEMLSSNDDESSNHSETTEGSRFNKEGIFDDVEDDNENALWNIPKKQTNGKRKLASASNYFSNLERAIKRRQRKQDKLDRLLVPEQFDDSEDFNPISASLIAERPRNSPVHHRKQVQKEMAPERPDAQTDTSETGTESAALRRVEVKIESPTDADVSHNDSKDPETNDATATSNGFKFDERKFFALPAFQPQVKEEAFRKIYAALEAPLKVLEEDGYEAYRQYLEYRDGDDDAGHFRGEIKNRGLFRKFHTKHSQQERERKREESIRNSLKNAIVNGDPREYQRKIFEIAKTRNTIVNLGTGAGKTLIALLLIREVWSAKGKEGKEKQPENTNGQGDAEKGNKTSAESIKNQKRQTLFLVPSVALAIQQGLTLRANLPHLHVQTACYASASSKRARAALGTCDVMVTTHGVIQDLLMHYGDTFRMDRFNLVVIDECHYAGSGNHAYRHLMRKFYHSLEEEKRPRVLGLTASPLLNVKETHSDAHLSTMLDNLERTLDAKMVSAAGLISVGTATSSSGGFLNRVIDERTFHFRGANMNRTIPQADNLDLLPSRYREFKQLELLYKDVGPLVTSIYCSVLQRELSKNVFENECVLQFNRAIKHLQRIEEFCNHEIKFLPNMGRNDKVLALEELIETLIEEKGGAKTIGLVFVERRITAIALYCYFVWRNQQILGSNSGADKSDWQFAKEARRQKTRSDTIFQLKGCNNEDDQFDDSIDDPFHIFQNQNKIQDEIPLERVDLSNKEDDNELDSTQFMDAESDSEDEIQDAAGGSCAKDSFHRLGRVVVKPVALVRHPVHIFNSLTPMQKTFKESEKEEQYRNWVHREVNVREVLNRLRRGDLNLMFATSVVEEGVDVQACSFVVAFDGLTNIKGYIQMKGRARKQDAKFFVFRDPNSTGPKLELTVAQKMENRIQRFIEERMRKYVTDIQEDASQNEGLPDVTALPKEIAAVEAGVYKVGDATVDVQSAKSLLNRYFLSIPLDPFVRNKKESLLAYMPCFESNRLLLPLHLPRDIRTVVLPPKYNGLPRREKQKLLSLMACVRLHCHGLLNERLLPLTRKDMQSRLMKVATQKLEKITSVPLKLNSFYSDDRRYLTVYKINQESALLSKYSDSLSGGGHTLGLIATHRIKSMDPLRFYHANFGKVDISLGEPVFISCSASQFDMLQKIFVLLANSRWARKSKNLFYEMRTKEQYDAVIPPYLVGILSQSGDLDWDFMTELVAESNRSIEERAFAGRIVSSSQQVSQPRICCTSYKQLLPCIIFGPSDKSSGAEMSSKEEGIETFRDYYRRVHSIELSDDCRLFQAHHMWSLDSGLPTKPRSTGNSNESLPLDACLLPEQTLIEQPLANAHVALLCVFLPQVLFSIERHQKTEAFIRHCESHIPTLGKCFRKMELSRVAIAITSKSCNSDENYDSWEWVGDAVLKLLQTDSILKSQKFKHFVKFLHEGDLSMLRSAMGTNERLRQICTHLCLEDYIMMTPLARGNWVPSPLQFVETSNSKVKSEDTRRVKVLADVIEAILGVIYLEFGYDVSMKVGNELHVTFHWDEADTSVACGEEGYIDNSELVNIVQRCTGHSKAFSRPKLLSEAFTHPSAIDALVPSYQRLEWIGDAVLCLCAREWLFTHMGENTSLGDLVVSESAIVCNETLGFLSMRFGLQEYLNHRDQSLPKRIESYCCNIQEGCGLWGGDPPKPIADVVEAMLGAIHVNGGFESGQEATRNLMSSIFSVFKHASITGPSGLNTFLKMMKHPKKALQEMTGQLLEVIACSEHEFATSYEDDDEDEQGDNTALSLSLPMILHKGEWRNPARSDGCQIAFVSILGRPLVVVADESITVAKNRASSLVREAIERRKDIKERMAECCSNVESGLTFASRVA